MPIKPSETEEEYFARKEYEKLRKIEEQNRKTLAAEERRQAKVLHFMKCPKCGMNLAEVDYRALKVDKCTACEGIWLDAGELEQAARLDKGGLDRFFSVFLRDK